MARKLKQSAHNSIPGLFDDFEVELPKEKLPVFPDIASHAEKLKAEEQSAINEPMKQQQEVDKMLFFSLGSGSSGNCSYVGNYKSGFLVDAGVDMKKVLDGLNANNIPIEAVKGICLTHDHGDHIRYAYTILKKYRHISLYCTSRVLNGILRRHNISRFIKNYHKPIYKEIAFNIDNFSITAFEVMHDGTDNMGFFIESGNHKFAIATDLGCISPRVDFYMRQADYIMIESNYDKEMLTSGSYPEYLKARIIADNGHLDNTIAARFIADCYSSKLKYVFLCHLSNDNNTPDIATHEVSTALRAKGAVVGDGTGSITSRQADIQLVALPRFDTSPLYIFRKD
jgi:phosphoribosyl 1,2-cyclic phosphodiesterase